jgi:hypothetical protein
MRVCPYVGSRVGRGGCGCADWRVGRGGRGPVVVLERWGLGPGQAQVVYHPQSQETLAQARGVHMRDACLSL